MSDDLWIPFSRELLQPPCLFERQDRELVAPIPADRATESVRLVGTGRSHGMPGAPGAPWAPRTRPAELLTLGLGSHVV